MQRGGRLVRLFRSKLREPEPWSDAQFVDRVRDAAVLEELRRIGEHDLLTCHCKRLDGSGECHGDVVALAWEWVRRKDAEAAHRAA